jgi:hypothetical protein
VTSSVRTYAERRESPLELVTRLEREFRPLPVWVLVQQYLVGHPWSERRIVLMITREWQKFKRERQRR